MTNPSTPSTGSGTESSGTDTTICTSCKKFGGYTNEDLKEIGTTSKTIILDCKNCGKPTIKLMGESLERTLGLNSTGDINLDDI